MVLKKAAREFLRESIENFFVKNPDLIIDDEKYFTFNGDTMPGNVRYYTNDKSECPDSVRFLGKEKYPKKLLVWIAISNKGMSKPLFRPQGSVAIKTPIYINECLKKRLLPFIKKYHQDSNYLFWPDLASAHYSKLTIEWMTEDINFVDKDSNLPNIPQA